MKILKTIAPYMALPLSLVLLFSVLVVSPSHAQNTKRDATKRIIVVNANQPNIWTLEQAHYLLAQMHRRNLDLKAKSLEDLDPNEINGLRFDIMRMLIEFGATFNQADLMSNRLFSQNQNFNSDRRGTLTADSDRLRKESLALTGEIDELEAQRADAESEEERARLDAKISSRKNRLARVDKETENVNSELKTLNVSPGELRATTGGAEFDPEKLPKSTFDDAFKQAAADQIKRFSEAPKLNASLRLENFLQMQYEIIAKQLALLRDELGPGERLLFLELPQTVNVTHHEANKKWAQSWWKIVGYTKREPNTEPSPSPSPSQDPSSRKWNQRPIKTVDTVNSMLEINEMQLPAPGKRPPSSRSEARYRNVFVDLADTSNGVFNSYLSKGAILSNPLVRTVELIPRQSSLNVSDMNLKVRAGAFNFVLSTLVGFGSQLSVQRQREQFSQFVQQELYSSAFGKGSREFGWTFTPMPGMDRLQSGVRTTYAIVVVPDDATSLLLEANGCYFPRSAYPPLNFDETKYEDWNKPNRTSRNCGGERTKAFIVPIPTGIEGTTDFWVRRVDYQPVGKGKQIVVLITGENFSNQMGVLINGVPLRHSIGLAQPLIRDDSTAGRLTEEEFKDAEVQGRIERVDARKIVFSFKMPEDFEGTPTITLVAPGKAIDLNWLTLRINDIEGPATLSPSNKDLCKNGQTADCVRLADPMFSGDPPPDFRIDKVEAFRNSNSHVNVLVTGAGFVDEENKDDEENKIKIFINGFDRTSDIKIPAPTLISATNIPAPLDDNIQVTLVSGKRTLNAAAVVNPLQLKIDKVTVVSYEPARKGNAGVLVVRIEGRGFTRGLVSSPRKVRLNVASSTEAFLTIPNPNQTEIVTLTDPITKVDVSTVIGRKAPE